MTMIDNMPFFSIVIPCYNSEEYLSECLESIIAQDFDQWEAIVINDASTDGSLAVASRFSAQDGRIRVLDKTMNEGLHLARKSGTALSRGEYILFLDSDDAFEKTTLHKIYSEIEQSNPDILRFGLICKEQNGMDDHAAREFETWANADSPESSQEELLTSTFTSKSEYGRDWHVTHKAFRGDICRKAFSSMTTSRLERAEDSYEFLVLASMSEHESSNTRIRGYIYNIGRGVTSNRTISPERFLSDADQMKACWIEAQHFADSMGTLLVRESASCLKTKLIFSLMNEWKDRVDDDYKLETAESVSSIIGIDETATELMRFARDDAYAMLGRFVPSSPSFLDWANLAEELMQDIQTPSASYIQMKNAALNHIREFTESQRIHANQEKQDVKILVSAHKNTNVFHSTVLQPIHVGAKNSSIRFPYFWRDDDGENISEKNARYCELTAQYWAWKNIDAEYYGFCHYRRYFDFSNVEHEENMFGEVIDNYIDEESAKEYALIDESIINTVKQFDVITTPFSDLKKIINKHGTPQALWEAAPLLHDDDLERCYRILCKMHPDYQEDADAFLDGHQACFCNMFIMKKAIFFDYCEWLFPILEEFDKSTDYSTYSKEALRTPGHLSERLLNIYLMHHRRIGSNWKFKELQCVHFTNPEPAPQLELPNSHGKPVIPVVFAADNNYVPQLTTTIYSAIKNANSDRFYDVIVLQQDIAGDKQERMWRFFEQFPNMSLRFLNVKRELSGYDLSTNNAHISIETYYRFLIQQLLPNYDKVLYLDSDIIIVGDIAKLYDIDLQDNLLGAVRDIDFLGNLNVKHGKRMSYARDVLKMKNPYDYFQAGVLVLNTKGMRNRYSIGQWLTYASNSNYIYNDQDVLNAYCEGKVLYLPWEWNVVHDCGGRVGNLFTQAPNDVYDAYVKSRSNPQIIHYAGYQKPWVDPDCDYASMYWDYARETPFYERLIKRVILANEPQIPEDVFLPKHERAVGEDNPIRKFVDPLMPIGSRRRDALKAVARVIRGRR